MLNSFLLAQAVELAQASTSKDDTTRFRRGMISCGGEGESTISNGTGLSRRASRSVTRCDDLA